MKFPFWNGALSQNRKARLRMRPGFSLSSIFIVTGLGKFSATVRQPLWDGHTLGGQCAGAAERGAVIEEGKLDGELSAEGVGVTVERYAFDDVHVADEVARRIVEELSEFRAEFRARVVVVAFPGAMAIACIEGEAWREGRTDEVQLRVGFDQHSAACIGGEFMKGGRSGSDFGAITDGDGIGSYDNGPRTLEVAVVCEQAGVNEEREQDRSAHGCWEFGPVHSCPPFRWEMGPRLGNIGSAQLGEQEGEFVRFSTPSREPCARWGPRPSDRAFWQGKSPGARAARLEVGATGLDQCFPPFAPLRIDGISRKASADQVVFG